MIPSYFKIEILAIQDEFILSDCIGLRGVYIPLVLVILYVSSFVVQLYFLYPRILEEEINNFYVLERILLCVSSFYQDLVILNGFKLFYHQNWYYKLTDAWVNYASLSFGEAYRDRQLTTNFELWVEIFCVSTCFHMRIPKKCVCPYPEKRNHLSFVNISPTLVINTSMERSSRILHLVFSWKKTCSVFF